MARWRDPEATGPRDTSAVMLIPGPPAQLTKKVFNKLQKLPSLVPPRVCSAVFHTLWNGWCSARRFQQGKRPTNRCWLGCAGEAEDSIEHYCHCPVARGVLQKKLRIQLDQYSCLPFFMLCTHASGDDELSTLTAMYIYAVYMTTNFYRKANVCDPIRASQCLGQYLIQSCEGSRAMGALLDSRWNKPYIFL